MKNAFGVKVPLYYTICALSVPCFTFPCCNLTPSLPSHSVETWIELMRYVGGLYAGHSNVHLRLLQLARLDIKECKEEAVNSALSTQRNPTQETELVHHVPAQLSPQEA